MSSLKLGYCIAKIWKIPFIIVMSLLLLSSFIHFFKINHKHDKNPPISRKHKINRYKPKYQ